MSEQSLTPSLRPEDEGRIDDIDLARRMAESGDEYRTEAAVSRMAGIALAEAHRDNTNPTDAVEAAQLSIDSKAEEQNRPTTAVEEAARDRLDGVAGIISQSPYGKGIEDSIDGTASRTVQYTDMAKNREEESAKSYAYAKTSIDTLKNIK